MSTALRIVHPTRVTPEPWANGGGRTRTLLAWPDPGQWALRISVADVETSGLFSVFSGVDRWFAVLEGDGVRLRTAGRAPTVARAADEEMHAFPGDDATDCELLGSPTSDLNVMVRRREARATIRRLRPVAAVRSNAEVLGCFVCDDAELATGEGAPIALPRHTLAWLENPSRETLEWQLVAPASRGWWIEANRTGADDDQAG
jgi:environmental stress-induced protein Ves